MEITELLKTISFGNRIAEEEKDNLSKYFVQTNQWLKIFNGEIDIIYGAKGSGKSAIYTSLNTKENELFDKNIVLYPAENPRGNPVFSSIKLDPPAEEFEFINLWKLYFILLCADKILEFDLSDNDSLELIKKLRELKLLPEKRTLSTLLKEASDYVKRLLRPKSIKPELKLNEISGAPTFSCEISFQETSQLQKEKGFIYINDLLSIANCAFKNNDFKIWITIDRLDVAFAETEKLENNALRALFKVYLDFFLYENIEIKIFLRDDIWKKITESGFREASHITKFTKIEWNKDSIMNMIIKRALNNKSIVDYYHVNSDEILNSSASQYSFFYKMFPEQLDVGEKSPKTFDWILTRTQDAKTEYSPREIIHLLNKSIESQIKLIELGKPLPVSGNIFNKFAVKGSLIEVSKTKLEQSIYAEFPKLKEYIVKLEREKTEHSLDSLMAIWGLDNDTVLTIVNSLVDIGFFEQSGPKDNPRYWVPFIFRPALELIQGTSE